MSYIWISLLLLLVPTSIWTSVSVLSELLDDSSLNVFFCPFLVGDRSSSPLPDFVPNTHPDELSCPPAEPGTGGRPSRNLMRRATPSAVSHPSPPPPQSPSQNDEAPPPRKVSDAILVYGLQFLTLSNVTAIETTCKSGPAFYHRHRRPFDHRWCS